MAYHENSSVVSSSWRPFYWKGVALPIDDLSWSKRRELAASILGWRGLSQAKELKGKSQDLTGVPPRQWFPPAWPGSAPA